MALYSIPAVGKDTWLVSLQHKETIAITAPLPDCPSSRGKSPNSASFSSCSHKVILTLLWSLQSVHILLNFWFSKLTQIFLLNFKVLSVITPCLHSSSCSSSCVQKGNVYFFWRATFTLSTENTISECKIHIYLQSKVWAYERSWCKSSLKSYWVFIGKRWKTRLCGWSMRKIKSQWVQSVWKWNKKALMDLRMATKSCSWEDNMEKEFPKGVVSLECLRAYNRKTKSILQIPWLLLQMNFNQQSFAVGTWHVCCST